MPSWNSILKSLVYTWKNHFIVQFATLSVLVATFTVVFSILSMSLNLRAILVGWGESVNITAYIKDEAQEQVAKIEESLRALGQFGAIEFVSKQETQKSFIEHMAKYSPDLMEDPEFSNPFPANFRITLEERAGFENLNSIIEKIVSIPGIEDVSYGQDWVENYASLVTAFSRSSWFVALVLLIGSAFVIGNSIRTSVNFRRDEIEILDLVGATKKMIWVPFVVDGLFLGLLSGGIALLVSYGFYVWGLSIFHSNLAFLALTSQFHYLSFHWIFLSLLLAGFIGAMSSYICVHRIASLSSLRRAEQ